MRVRFSARTALIALFSAIPALCLSTPSGTWAKSPNRSPRLHMIAGLSEQALTQPGRPTQTVKLEASFNPDRFGARTTIEFAFQVHSTVPKRAPAPLTGIDLHLPSGLGLATSTLGLANCAPGALLAGGVTGCPANARIGFGSATVAVPAEGEPVEETGTLTALVGPPNSEHLEVLFYAEGRSPVFAQLVFPGHVLEDSPPFSGRLETEIPLIPTWPDGPDVSITSFTSTIGPRGLTYYRRIHGGLVPFRPRGIAVPARCPRGGFPFRVDITFMDGTQQTATSVVPCPR